MIAFRFCKRIQDTGYKKDVKLYKMNGKQTEILKYLLSFPTTIISFTVKQNKNAKIK